jgi:sulfatase modifying factor 1
MNPTSILRAACILLLSAITLRAEIPNLINYQGRLTDAQGNPVTGNRTMSVRVYDAPAGGNMTYEENIGKVFVTNGAYSFQFGSAGDGILGLLVGGSEYLALTVNGAEESTRTRLLAVPYAMKAREAQYAQESADAQELLAEARVISVSGDMDFGIVRVGGSQEKSLYIENRGFMILKIEDIELPEGFSIVTEYDEPIILKPYETINATIKFSPVEANYYSGNIHIRSNKTGGSDSITCLGKGILPTILSNGVAAFGLSGEQGSFRFFSFEVPWYATSLMFKTNGGEGNLDFYFRFGELPTLSNWGAGLLSTGTPIELDLTDSANWGVGLPIPPSAPPKTGEYFVMLYGRESYSNYDFLMQFGGDPPEFIHVQGGILPSTSLFSGIKVENFEIGQFEVTWGEWQKVMEWALNNGYSDMAGNGAGSADNHPVRDISANDIWKWCNAKSEMEGLTPVYTIDGEIYRSGYSTAYITPYLNTAANGYRLPTEEEWEWAARGGVDSQGYTFSGSNDLDEVGWYWDNSIGSAVNISDGRGTWPVGQKAPNEIGIYDMSGNVWELCEPINDSTPMHSILYPYRGGSWSYDEFPLDARDYLIVLGDRGRSFGFRLARNAP